MFLIFFTFGTIESPKKFLISIPNLLVRQTCFDLQNHPPPSPLTSLLFSSLHQSGVGCGHLVSLCLPKCAWRGEGRAPDPFN